MSSAEPSEYLFSYGTLQDEAVQLATFDRKLVGRPDALPGYRPAKIAIQDPDVIAIGGKEYYLNAQYTGRDSDVVAGTTFRVTSKELEQADVYEADADYKRVRIRLKSGTQAWVYVSAAGDIGD